MKILFVLVACILMSCSAAKVEKVTFTNPVIFADVPDVDVIRVDNDYYMISTTMHLMPGAPVMRSKDLVNWEIISYLFDENKDSPLYDLEGGTVYGHGQWASSLRYHNGRFYAFFATNRPSKSYIYSTDNPAGMWKKIGELNAGHHDASLLFDDNGKVYLAHGGGKIRIRELKDDLSDVQPEGLNVEVIDGDKMGYPGLLEGTHLMKLNGKYYMFLIWWPQGGIRTELCFRSDKIEGPYESKVILSDTIDLAGAGVAQGCIVDTKDGDWYGFLFQDHGAVGRTPVIMPCRWEDGWPVLGDNEGKVAKVMKKPVSGYPEKSLVISDDFKETKLPYNWQWNHNPDNHLWSLTERPGYMRLKTGKVVNNVFEARNTLSQRTEGPVCSGTISMDVSAMKDGDIAGFSAFNGHAGLLSVLKEDGKKYLAMSISVIYLGEHERVILGIDKDEKERVELKQDIVYLRIDCDFSPKKDIATFYYSLDNKNWIKIGTDFQMIYDYRKHFMGSRFAIYNYATQVPGGYVDIDYFKYQRDSLPVSGQ